MNTIDITFLGTGTSQGVPIIACPCPVCKSPDAKDKRLRSSILVEMNDTTLVVDSGPDFRQQMLREDVKKIDALLFTHAHKDHIAGMDDIRAFNYVLQKPIDVYADTIVERAMHREFPYIFDGTNYPGIPQINLKIIGNDTFHVGPVPVIPIEVMHYNLPVKAFRFGDFTYITDANFIAEGEKEKIKGSKVVVINALRKEKHISHYSLEEAIALSQELGAERTYFTHISHQLGLHEEVEAELPKGIFLAYDGLRVTV